MPLPEFFSDKARRKRQNKRSQRQEAAHAAKVGGKVQRGSGSHRAAPQDVRADEHLDQIKYTDKPRYTLHLHELLHIRKDALMHGREGRMFIQFERHGFPPLKIKITFED